jgi:Ca2+/Na+ antiporter
MDANTAGGVAGLVGGIVGSVIGIMGGVIGTYCSIRNTTRPRERALMIRMSLYTWLWVGGWLVLAGLAMFLLPRPWSGLTAGVSLPILLPMIPFIPFVNRKLAEARTADEANVDPLDHSASLRP